MRGGGMIKNTDTADSQTAQFTQWISKQAALSGLNENQRQVILNKTHLLGRAQDLAAQTNAILLSELDNENMFNTAIEQDLNTPTLSAPTAPVKASGQNGKGVELLTTLMMLSSEVSLHDLSLQLSNLMASYESYRKVSNQLDEDLEKHLGESETATQQASEAQDKLEELQNTQDEITKQISEKKQELQSLSEGTPEYETALSELKQLEQGAVTAEQAVVDQKAVFNEKMAIASDAIQAVKEDFRKQNLFAAQSSNIGGADGVIKKQLTNAAKLSELIAFFMQLINKNSESDLESELSVFESMQKSVQSDMEKKATEMEEQQKKAEELQKTMGCIGKIIGAIVTVVSVVSAAFTGGASLAIAGVGLALMAGDLITEAATGRSLTDRVMAPFMEHVFLPLMGIIEKVIDKILEYTPLGKLLNLIGEITGTDITSIAKTAIAALATIAIIVAVAYLAKTAGEAAVKKLFGAAVDLVLKQVIPEVTTDLVKQVSQSIVQRLGEIAATVGIKNQATQMRALQLQKFTQYLSYANQGTQVTSNVIVADFKEQATKALASFKLAQTDLDNIKKVLESVVSDFEHSQGVYRDLAKLISDSMHTEAKTGKQVLTNMRI